VRVKNNSAYFEKNFIKEIFFFKLSTVSGLSLFSAIEIIFSIGTDVENSYSLKKGLRLQDKLMEKAKFSKEFLKKICGLKEKKFD